MSWSLLMVGNSEKVAEALDAFADKLSGQSKDEYLDVRDGLKAIVLANMQQTEGYGGVQGVKITASGHAGFTDGKKIYGMCSVNVEPVATVLV